MRRFVHGLIAAGIMATTAGAQQMAEQTQTKTDKDFPPGPGIIAVLAVDNCFTSGSGATFLKVCINENGNISWLESPAGKRHINTREGYAVCSYDTSMTVHGFDVNIAADGWGPATVSDNKRIITRTSLDGMVQLKQTFTILPADRAVDVKMEVKNLSAITLPALLITRYFDGDISGTPDNEYFHNGQAIWGMEGYGLMLNPAPTANVDFYPHLLSYSDWNPSGASLQAARGCVASLHASGVTGDYVGGITTLFANVKAGQSKSVTLHYRRF